MSSHNQPEPLHDFAEGDHARMAGLVSRFRHTRVVVSYYDHPLVRELYEGWTFVDCTMSKALVNQGQRGREVSSVAPEVLIIKGPSFTQEAGLFEEMEAMG